MRIKSSYKIRLLVRLKLYKDGQEVDAYSSVIKSRILRYLQGKPSSEWDYGVCTVVYDSRRNVYNEFDFTNLEDFMNKYPTSTELPLLQFIAGGKW